MRLLASLLVLGVCAPVLAEPPARTSYRLTATLDPTTHRVDGEVAIRFVNHASRGVRELYFHLYPNAFAHDDTVFMREGGSNIRGRDIRAPGSLEVRTLETADGVDLLADAARELVPNDRTQLRVALPRTVEPGEALELRGRFTTQLPEIVARSGYAGSFHMLGQWFPKLAKLEDSGAFASFPYHGLGEFYADFADYELALTVPRNFVVAAGGVRVASREHGALRTDTFRAEQVHDVAAAAAPDLERHISRAGTVRLEVYAPPGYGAAVKRQALLLSAGLAYFSRAYGAYPYPQLTAVIPPHRAAGAAGMEYPTLLLSGGPWWALPPRLPDPAHDVFAAHELAHQWFSGIVATNEVAVPALDEGLTEWASFEFLRAHFPLLQRPGFDPFDLLEAMFLFRGHPVPSSLSPVTSYRYDKLVRAVYMRPARVLDAIGRRHGRPRLMAAMGRYAREQRFRHPGFAELFAAFDAEYGRGFAERELRPGLAGGSDFAPAGTVRPEAKRWLPDVWFAIQTLLHVLGP